jgi:hypothetical protein
MNKLLILLFLIFTYPPLDLVAQLTSDSLLKEGNYLL